MELHNGAGLPAKTMLWGTIIIKEQSN
jgi:hypothetical protein